MGFLYQLRWYTPYSEPPDGMPRVLAEFYDPQDQPRKTSELLDLLSLHTIGDGYTLYIQYVPEAPVKEMDKEKLASIRKKRLKRRLQAKYPLFAEQFEQEEMAKRAEYYEGKTDAEIEARRQEVLAHEKARLEYLQANAGKILIYGEKPEGWRR